MSVFYTLAGKEINRGGPGLLIATGYLDHAVDPK